LPEDTGNFSSESLSFAFGLLLRGSRSLNLTEPSDEEPSICRIIARASR
ncbi:hypothetical protein T4E_2132, partial [Trichinella pseudospiralis]